ncbi:PREDICTED: facilitated trehalose transporter Tret1-2 homolog isoform X2 [Diuraphis noxia]|uniref:facilitated trehalose transporter Tret1-2 homolog isoform X2 n=1 Tax=Diuraphis noxia TaxID=143948 RepID=UPI000763A0B9|nr:PREDICTED: facilitated trehalose transporter Tret1-2 homolog isoform X2 [Diuraphis noxia]
MISSSLRTVLKKPPKPLPQQTHRLNLTGGGGPPRRKTSGYTRPQFAGPMELETLMEEGASPGPGSREGDAPTADDGTRASLSNGDKAPHRHLQEQQRQEQQLDSAAAAMKSNSERPRSSLNLYLAACTANMGALAAGCALTWSSPTLVKLLDGDTGMKITKDESSWVGSLVTLGAAIGPILAGVVLDRLGRKSTILLSMILSAISWIIIGSVPGLMALYVARVLAGIAVGVIFTAVPMYIAEIAEMRLRSSLGTLMQFFLVVGFLIEYIVGPYSSYLTLVIVSLATPVLCFGMFIWMPDSPQSLLIRPGGEQKAMESLRWLRGNPQETALIKELEEIKKSIDEAKKEKSGFAELFANRGNIKAVIISCAMVAWQQFSGINVVLLYSEPIFLKTGVQLSASVSTIIVGTVMLIAAGVTPSLAKITTMRTLLYISAIGMAITDGTLGLFFYLQESGRDVSSIGWLPVTSLVLFIITYCLGFGPLPWAIMGEIFPTNLKSVASALTASFCWILGFILTKLFGAVSDAIGIYSVFWIFAVCCIFALLFTAFLLPQTEGKTLQEIQDMLHGRNKSSNHKMTRA